MQIIFQTPTEGYEYVKSHYFILCFFHFTSVRDPAFYNLEQVVQICQCSGRRHYPKPRSRGRQCRKPSYYVILKDCTLCGRLRINGHLQMTEKHREIRLQVNFISVARNGASELQRVWDCWRPVDISNKQCLRTGEGTLAFPGRVDLRAAN